jgi:hypothetical protein
MDGEYSTHISDVKCVQNWLETLRERDDAEKLGVDGWIILELILGK